MKTTFDLPEPLLRRAKALAAHQGRPLRDVVAEALDEKLAAAKRAASAGAARTDSWKAFRARLKPLPDGSLYNPDGIADNGFFESLEAVRAEGRACEPRDPFADSSTSTSEPRA